MTARITSHTLPTTRQEKVTGLLSATLLLLSLVTLLLGGVWLSQQPRHGPVVTRVGMRAGHEWASGSTGAAETARTLEDLGIQEQQSTTEQVAARLQTVSALAIAELSAPEESGGPAKGKGVGNIPGDEREVGPGGPSGPSGPIGPAWQRWQIHYSASGLDEYAAILDDFGVELGVMGGGKPAMDYARGLSQLRPITRLGSLQPDSRLRFVFERGELKAADRALARKAGISIEGRLVCQFFPEEVRQRLELLEKGALGSRPLASVRQTVFGIRNTGRGREFFVERFEPAELSGSFTPL